MARALAVIGVLVILAAGAIVAARSLGVIQLSQPAPASRIYVAISRSEDETAAQEIEVIDVASGERSLIEVGVRISALALSADRRTLLVGADDGRVLLLDPNTGSAFAAIATRRPSHLVELGTERFAVVHVTPEGGGVISSIDLKERRETAALALAVTPGKAVARDGRLYVPALGGTGNVFVEVSFDPITGRPPSPLSSILGRLISGAPQLLALGGGTLAYIGPWESGLGGARLLLGAGAPEPRFVPLQIIDPGSDRPLRGLREVHTAMTAGSDGAIHACLGNVDVAGRYRVDPRTGASERVGAECGAFARTADGTIALAIRGRASLALLDASGRVTRSLPLPGIPVAVAPN